MYMFVRNLINERSLMEKTEKKDTYPDLGSGEYEIKLKRTNKGEVIESFTFKKSMDEKPNPTGQYL